MKYFLLDAAINNDLGEYDSEEDALAVVRALVDRFGETYADDLVLASDDEFDDRAWTGEALLNLAVRSSRLKLVH